MIAGMICYKHLLQAVALGNACCQGKHNTVAERHNRRLHVALVIVALGYGIGSVKQRALEIIVHEGQRHNDVLNV